MIGVVWFVTYFLVAQPTVKGRLPATSTASTEYRFIWKWLLANSRPRRAISRSGLPWEEQPGCQPPFDGCQLPELVFSVS
jgi:hypothetical protein